MKISITAKTLLWLFLGIVGINGIIQSFLLPYTTLNNGMGYDGMHYIYRAFDLNYPTDSYHIFRLLPSYIVYFGTKLIGIEPTFETAIRGFQILNLVCHLSVIVLCYYIAQYFTWNNNQSILFYSCFLFNFWIMKHAYYSPVMTDSAALLLATALAYTYFSQKDYGLLGISLISLFVLPLVTFIGTLLYMVPRQYTQKNILKSDIKLPSIIAILFTAFLFYNSYNVVIMKNIRSVYSYSVNADLFWISISTLCISAYLTTRILFNSISINSLWSIVNSINIKRLLFPIVILLTYFFTKSLIINENGLNTNDIFWINGGTYKVFKPLIGWLDHFNMYGLLFILIIIYFKKIILNHEHNPALLLILFIALYFSYSPEARISVSFLPIVCILFINVIDGLSLKDVVLLSIAALLMSKFWYPLDWAVYGADYIINAQIFLNFPTQHYYQFIGLAMSNYTYVIWSIVFIVSTGSIYYYLNCNRQNN